MCIRDRCLVGRGKKLLDTPVGDTTPQTDQFLERCGSKPLLKIISMLPGQDITKLTFAKIKEAIEVYIAPRKRLIIADRTSFLQLSQREGESVVDFLTRINDASIHCKWDSLSAEGPNDELINCASSQAFVMMVSNWKSWRNFSFIQQWISRKSLIFAKWMPNLLIS